MLRSTQTSACSCPEGVMDPLTILLYAKQRMPILSDTDMSLFELKTRYVRNYFTYAGKNSKDFLLYISGPRQYMRGSCFDAPMVLQTLLFSLKEISPIFPCDIRRAIDCHGDIAEIENSISGIVVFAQLEILLGVC